MSDTLIWMEWHKKKILMDAGSVAASSVDGNSLSYSHLNSTALPHLSHDRSGRSRHVSPIQTAPQGTHARS